MIPFLKKAKVACSCIGNHDFVSVKYSNLFLPQDFGVEKCRELIEKSELPWLMSNLKMRDTGLPIAGLEHFITTHNGVKVGMFGIAEHEWFEILDTFTEETVAYEPFIECS